MSSIYQHYLFFKLQLHDSNIKDYIITRWWLLAICPIWSSSLIAKSVLTSNSWREQIVSPSLLKASKASFERLQEWRKTALRFWNALLFLFIFDAILMKIFAVEKTVLSSNSTESVHVWRNIVYSSSLFSLIANLIKFGNMYVLTMI